MFADMDHHPVLELELARCRALAAGDLAQVATLCSPRLVYVHSPGVVHGRSEFLQFLRDQVRFSAVSRRQLQVRPAGEVAWTTGLLRYEGCRLPGEQPFVAVSFVTQVWRQCEEGWQMEVCQSTRVEEEMWRGKHEVLD
jgi:ketosteroid isomerase-like protein